MQVDLLYRSPNPDTRQLAFDLAEIFFSDKNFKPSRFHELTTVPELLNMADNPEIRSVSQQNHQVGLESSGEMLI